MKKDRRVMPYRGKFIQSTGLNNRIYNLILKKLKAKGDIPSNDLTYYLVRKEKIFYYHTYFMKGTNGNLYF